MRRGTAEDLDAVSAIHQASFPADVTSKLGHGVIYQQYAWFLKNFPERFIVAVSFQTVLGFAVGAQPDYRSKLRKDLLGTMFFALLRRPWRLLKLRQRIISTRLHYSKSYSGEYKSQNLPILSDSLYLAVIAVDPAAWGTGVGTKLLNTFDTVAISLGFRTLSLMVREDNCRAKSIYVREGWIPLWSNRYSTFFYKNVETK